MDIWIKMCYNDFIYKLKSNLNKIMQILLKSVFF